MEDYYHPMVAYAATAAAYHNPQQHHQYQQLPLHRQQQQQQLPQPPPPQTSIHNLRTLFSLLSDDAFESEVELERQRRYGGTERPATKSRTRKRTPPTRTTALALNNDDSDNNNNNNDTSPRSRKRKKKNTTAATASPNNNTYSQQQQQASPEFQSYDNDDDEDYNNNALPDSDDDDENVDDDDNNDESDSRSPATTTETLGRRGGRSKKPWNELFADLEQFKRTHGHVHVTIYMKEYADMFYWLTNQRDQWKKRVELGGHYQGCTLTEEMIQRMIDIGLGTAQDGPTDFQKLNDAAAWDAHYQQLVEWKKENGHCNVTQGKDKSAPQYKLARWLNAQRMCYQNRESKATTGKRKVLERGALSDERLAKLEALGVCLQHSFDKRVESLRQYIAEHGKVPPTRYKGHDNLGPFVEYVKKQYRTNKLEPERIAKLEAVGMDWGVALPPPPPFDEKVEALAQYIAEHGCAPPSRYKGHNNLGKFVENIKKQYRLNKLAPDRIAKLEAIGMDWNPPPIFDKRVESLAQYIAEHGHIPQNRYKGHNNLGKFVEYIKKLYKTNKLAPERISKLESIGMDWGVVAVPPPPPPTLDAVVV